MEIHFYESIRVVPKNRPVLHYWESVNEAIDKMLDEIHTTQMCMMSTTLIIHYGYRIFVHQSNGCVYEITLKSRGGTGDYAVRDSQNIYGMWASNAFRITKTVGDYVDATKSWITRFNVDGNLYETANDIPCYVKNMFVDSFNHSSSSDMVYLLTKN